MINTELNKKAFEYILNSIDSEDYGIKTNTDKEKLQFVLDCFKSEYVNNGRFLNITHFAGWLGGLPSAINIDFENHKILELAISWGSLNKNSPKSKKDYILNNWFNFIANKFFQLCKKNKISLN